MAWQYNSYVLPLILTAGVAVILAFYVWRRRPTPGAAPIALLMIAVAEWSLAYALRLGSVDLATKVFWSQVRNIGVAVTPVAWLAFALQYTGREKWLTRRNVALLAIEPSVALLLAWTNGHHGLIWNSLGLDTGGSFPVLVTTYGAWYWINAAYFYLLFLLGASLLAQRLIRSPGLYRRQSAALLIGILIPVAGHLCSNFHLIPSLNLNLTPFGFAVSGLTIAWGLFRYRLLDVAPLARDAIIKDMSDGVIVLDTQIRVVDLNPSAERIIDCLASDIIGQPLAQILPLQPDIVERCRRGDSVHTEAALEEGAAARTYDVRAAPLRGWRDRVTGHLIVLRDVTELKQADESLRKARKELEVRVQERTAELTQANESLQSQIAEREQAEKEMQRRATQMALLYEVGQRVSGELELDALLSEIVAAISETLGYYNVMLLLLDERNERLIRKAIAGGYSDVFQDVLQVAVGKGMIGRAAETGATLVSGDVSQAPYYVRKAGEDTRSELAVPIKSGEKVIGVLDVQSSELGAFDESDVVAIETLSAQIAVAIENARLYEAIERELAERKQAEQALARHNRELALLNRASQAFSSTLDLDQVLAIVLEEARRLLSVTACSVWLVEPETKDIVCRHSIGPHSDVVLGWRLPPGEGVAGWVVSSGEMLIVPDTQADERYFNGVDQKTGLSLRSILNVPLRAEQKVIGVLQVMDTNVDSFDAADASLIEPLAASASIAIENARLHRKVIEHADQLEQRVQERTAQLQAQYARLEAILGSTTDGIIVASALGDMILANRVARTWLNQTLSPEDAARLLKTVKGLARRASEQPESVLELTGLDLELKVAPVEGEAEAKEPVVVVAVHDISHLKALDRVKTRFVSNVSHELRTPITTIKLYAALMRKRPEKWDEYLDTLILEADRQARLVEEILQISRIDTGRLEINPRPVSLNELVEATVINRRALAESRGLTLKFELAEPGPMALIDPERVMQVLNNLAENAIHYTPEGGEITVSTGTREAEGRIWATATVVDTGMGIPEGELPHIFERFFRGEEPRSMQISGTGLGLAIVKEIVELHGGRVTVESEMDVGSTFTVWLPLAGQIDQP